MTGECFLCGKYTTTESHHLFGSAMRAKSTYYKLTVNLCIECHRTGRQSVHQCADTMQKLHEYGQRKAMQENNWSIADFRQVFYKNYLEEE